MNKFVNQYLLNSLDVETAKTCMKIPNEHIMHILEQNTSKHLEMKCLITYFFSQASLHNIRADICNGVLEHILAPYHEHLQKMAKEKPKYNQKCRETSRSKQKV